MLLDIISAGMIGGILRFGGKIPPITGLDKTLTDVARVINFFWLKEKSIYQEGKVTPRLLLVFRPSL
jgi:hypothetical protein